MFSSSSNSNNHIHNRSSSNSLFKHKYRLLLLLISLNNYNILTISNILTKLNRTYKIHKQLLHHLQVKTRWDSLRPTSTTASISSRKQIQKGKFSREKQLEKTMFLSVSGMLIIPDKLENSTVSLFTSVF